MDKFSFDLQQLLVRFRDAWTEREAYRIKQEIEAAGQIANWEKVLQGAKTLAQGIFQPALSDLDNQSPLSLVLEKLLERLAAPRK
jgi:hypothetical protein